MAVESRRRNWSRYEVEATVASYLEMLVLERQGLSYNKAERRRALQALLEGRSERAIEDKHQNISAALIDLGYPPINGYKPLVNYQGLVKEVVESQVSTNAELAAVLEAELESPIRVPSVDDILARLEAPPDPRPRRKQVRERPIARYGRPSKDYATLDARNSALGLEGERFAVNFEKARLVMAGQERLVDDVEHVSVTIGDGEGYDIRSFDDDGSKRLIEVKTTSYGKYWPFFVSPNELEVSRQSGEAYHVYRVFEFRHDPRLFMLRGPMDRTLNLEPSQYKAFVG